MIYSNIIISNEILTLLTWARRDNRLWKLPSEPVEKSFWGKIIKQNPSAVTWGDILEKCTVERSEGVLHLLQLVWERASWILSLKLHYLSGNKGNKKCRLLQELKPILFSCSLTERLFPLQPCLKRQVLLSRSEVSPPLHVLKHLNEPKTLSYLFIPWNT